MMAAVSKSVSKETRLEPVRACDLARSEGFEPPTF